MKDRTAIPTIAVANNVVRIFAKDYEMLWDIMHKNRLKTLGEAFEKVINTVSIENENENKQRIKSLQKTISDNEFIINIATQELMAHKRALNLISKYVKTISVYETDLEPEDMQNEKVMKLITDLGIKIMPPSIEVIT